MDARQVACPQRLPEDTRVAVDIRKKKVVSMEVTSEEVYDGRMLKKLVKRASENNDIRRALADGAYDSKDNFRYLADHGIEAAIKVKKRIHLARLMVAIQGS
jgi:actin-like ATPase involved in cell morphogenesis